MHLGAMKFLKDLKEDKPEIFEAKRIIECGSMNVNGTVRILFEQVEEYIGVDWREGEGVDVVSLFHDYDEKPDGYFDVAVSTECFEHDPYWQDSIKKMIKKIRIGGSLVITCAGRKRQHHRFSDSPAYPEKKYYKNLTPTAIGGLVVENAEFESVNTRYDAHENDVYAYCFNKKGRRGFPHDHLFLHLIKEREFKRVAEIGVSSGNLAARVLNNTKHVEKYYAVDPWKVYIESYNRPPHAKERDQGWWDSLHERVKKMEEKFPVLVTVRKTSVHAAMEMTYCPDDFLDCVYIDAIHDEENIVKDIVSWLPLIRDGGAICGHDYTKSYMDMCLAINKIFEDDLNVMVINNSKPALSYKNTYQGGNWWVNINKNKMIVYLKRATEHYSEHIKTMNREWEVADK